MSSDPHGGQRAPEGSRMRLDLTVNVPTILTLCTMTLGGLTAGVRLYNDLDDRTTRNSYELVTLREKVTAVEGSLVSLKTETGATAQALRAEIKADLAEIKSTLNDIAFGRRTGATARDWTRQ